MNGSKRLKANWRSGCPFTSNFDRALQRAGVPTVRSLRDLYLMFAHPNIASLNPQWVPLFDAIAVPGASSLADYAPETFCCGLFRAIATSTPHFWLG
ncbi:MAG: hypothetical protein HC895_19355 [Leptolyngbyaceae cyanobacterium SM1_3_5]|nr:hypothetical protein [Leptolyngbyaceae cyanobacterium SM1_3_5]